MKVTNKEIVKRVESIIEDALNGPCSFWACDGPYHKNGNLRHFYISMVTCSRCNAISGANNLIKKLTGSYYQPK